MEVMLDYPWKGNLFQIESFCERLILMAGKRSIDEVAVLQTVRGAVSGADSGPQQYAGKGSGLYTGTKVGYPAG